MQLTEEQMNYHVATLLEAARKVELLAETFGPAVATVKIEANGFKGGYDLTALVLM